MKRPPLALVLVCALALICLLAACSKEEPEKKPEVDWLRRDFPAAVEAARETTVRLALEDDSEAAAHWVDTWLAPELKRRHGITLERVSGGVALARTLAAEKAAGTSTGGVDLFWTGGAGFRDLKRAGALFGPFSDKLPNVQAYVNREVAATDMGLPTEGFEVPAGWNQFVFEYDSAKVKNPPDTFAELLDWCRGHPGRFTYPAPPDSAGSAFLRQALCALSGGGEQYAGPFNEGLYRDRAALLWAYLEELRPLLWNAGKTQPKDAAALAALLARGEVDLAVSLKPLHAQHEILAGRYKDTVRTFVPREGSVFGLSSTLIPFNAPNKPGAMVTADLILSPEAQLSKFDPRVWGDFPAVDVTLLPQETQSRIVGTKLGKATLPFGALGVSAVPDMAGEYGRALDQDWVARFATGN
ncbi:MAG TPA: ABC transporter substrate-binding protein [Desulfovibrio sp.]|uniref:ABC transporter substrate-binding protein n=1 Tax=Desulfovibrio sp. TaxID=885 RepID=UPI002D191C4B|nr:ABC transporter substrate-binding protein [Desulfovibrio sp.]HMM38102.1 ABC transporter substrate-binding protein [Desulfovibrio sp.]